MDDRDTVFQKHSLFASDGPVHLLSPTSASPPLKELTQLTHTMPEPIMALWLHTEVSSLKNLMIPLSLGGGPKENRQSLEYPGASVHPDVYLSCHLR